MNSRLPIIKQRQRDHLFQSHAATQWWIYSLFKGLWSSPLQGTASFERKSYTLPFTQSHSEATCSTAIRATTETEHDCPRDTNRIYRGDKGPGMQDTGENIQVGALSDSLPPNALWAFISCEGTENDLGSSWQLED